MAIDLSLWHFQQGVAKMHALTGNSIHTSVLCQNIPSKNRRAVKTLSAMLGHVSAATTMDIYTHITDDMQRTAADIDCDIGKARPQEGSSSLGRETARAKSRE